jgi:YidC/Oxa1 family membrane protein insertase
MIATTYYQQKQMQRASPSQNQQQQMLARIMPVFFGFIGYTFPAGLVVYWTTTNAVQIIQQHYMLPKPEPATGSKGRGDGKTGPREKGSGMKKLGGQSEGKGSSAETRRAASQGEHGDDGGEKPRPKEGGDKRGAAGRPGGGQGNRAGRGPGGRNGGDRKKRRKR